MEQIIIFILVTNLILLLILLLKSGKKLEGNNEKDFAILGEKISSLANVIEEKNKNIISQEMINISSKLADNNEKLIARFGEMQNSLTKSLGDNNEKLTKKFTVLESNIKENINDFNEKLITKFGEMQNSLTKSLGDNNEKLTKKFTVLESNIKENINDFNNNFKANLDKNIEKLITNVEIKLEKINEKVEDRLKTGFEKTNETFTSIIARLAKIDEAQKNIEALSGNIISLQDILTDKKSRGTFGEIQLYQILNSVFGEPKNGLYQTQYKFGNGTIADSVLFAPEPIGTIAIDSKFPLENYRKMVDKNLSTAERKSAELGFKSDMKKHIDNISIKYIIPQITSNQAIMFLPAEAIFAEINAYYSDIIEYAQKKKVWIASPTTLMAVLNTLQIIVRNAEREKYANIIHTELIKLSEEFGRYRSRWDKLSSDIDKVSKDVKEINTTSDKISKRFFSISNVDDNIKEITE